MRRAVFHFENDPFALFDILERNEHAVALLYGERREIPTGFPVRFDLCKGIDLTVREHPAR